MADSNFDVLTITSADLAHAGLALTAARAGAVGVLDLEFVTEPSRALHNFERLLAGTTGRVGLRVTANAVSLAHRLIATADARRLTVILAGPVGQLAELRSTIGLRSHDLCLAEIVSAAEAIAAQVLADGLVARGHEAGGWVGEDSSFLMLQKLSGKLSKRWFVQGGIGLRASAACRVAGASGVVLDDALLLLAESPLALPAQEELARLNGAECRLLGEQIGRPCRVYSRPGNPLLKKAEETARTAESGALGCADWAAGLHQQIGWNGDHLLPLGQGIGVAASYRDRYRSVGGLIQAVRRASLRQGDRAAVLGFIDENGPLAQSHGTRYPLAQGPMTRVSDSPAFAAEVAGNGALPFLALALMRAPQVAEMLSQTRARVGDRPWGVGLLGFVPEALRNEQCAEIWKCKPPFALIAGGRPDQAAEFEQHGIATYIHAPAPALLKLYLEQGARRFVFEGRECGGHVGPLGSFPLWEQMVEVLLDEVPAGEESKIHLLFAGGIHDALSGAMLAAMVSPLAERGMKVGALMGTAYLFTREIVSSGAVVEGFQNEALRCERTMNLESGPGHASRCIDTRFAHDFYDTRRRLIREGRSTEEIRETLEDLNLGRLRVASKGVNRDDTGRIVEVPLEQQGLEGMYMIGQVATLRDEVLLIAELHADVTRGAQRRLQACVEERLERAQDARPSDIAIVGIGITLPGADSPDDYWKLLLDQTPVLREAPAGRWDHELYFDPDPKARDKVYSKWGGFLDEIPFDPMRFGIPPNSMKSIDTFQLLTLETATRTLADAGYSDGQFDRENTSVILGAGGGAGDLGVQYSMRSELPRFVENPSADVWERLPEWTEESFAGTLLNVAAGRVANRLDFGGVNFTVDAACGSSLAAISIAVHELETGRSNLVLAGGFDTTQSAFAFTAFAKTQALSARGQPRTFDQSADGIAISEGVAMVALKRLADAERDGDRIYAVIKATAGSSDGRALGLTAPRSEGQVRALNRAYRQAGFGPATLGLIEAHGTGTAVGDRTEVQTIARALNQSHASPRSVALGSVKTLIGHTKAAAGVAGLIKVALSLHHRVLPGHFGVDKPIDAIADPGAPVYLLKDARPWLAQAANPRRGAASAFGFGGTNFHAVLEEYAGGTGARGGNRWPVELFVFRAADVAALTREIERIVPHLQPGSRVRPGELARALARRAELRRSQPVTLALVAADLKSLAADLALATAHLQGGNRPLPANVKFSKSVPAHAPAVAFLFPGQGAQYLNMGREAALFLPEVREALELADRVLIDEFRSPLSSLTLPPAAFDAETEAAQARALTDTRVAQPAIGALSLGYLRLAERLGITPLACAGHSYGEYTALMAAGVIQPADFLRLSAARGSAMAAAAKSTQPGSMAAVQGSRERITALIAGFDGVRVANHNAPEQSVISGPRERVEAATQKLTADGLRATLLAVSGAFHTDLVAPARAPLSAAIHATPFAPASVPVFSNSTGVAYPAEPLLMQNLLDGHLLSSVEFVTELEAMYAAGARVFLELGPKGICSGMARHTLAGRDASAISLDANGGGLRGLLIGVAELLVAGIALDLMALFAERDLPALDLAQLAERAKPLIYPKHWWMVSGGCSRPINDPVLRTGAKPALTRASSEAARSAIETRLEARGAERERAIRPASTAGPVAAVVAATGAALSSEALLAYQQTMRQFLTLQERVLQQYLTGTATPPAPAQALAVPTLSRPESMTAPLPVPAAIKSIETPAATPMLAPSAGPRPPRTDWKAALIEVVSARTGYPVDMLAMDADLEADLGIDSIKRVEILGAFRKVLPDNVAEAMQQRMERLTRPRSLSALLTEIRSFVPTAAPGPRGEPAAAVTVGAALPAAVSVDFAGPLLRVVADRTGYPTDMLDMSADLEADLGIDSIKRVEILGAFRKSLPTRLASAMQAGMERFTRARSLAAILAELRKLEPSAGVAEPAPVAVNGVVTAQVDHLTLVLGIVSERTGYPAEMLALEADLEADLGIDSIKRVEILGALRKTLPPALAADVQARMEQFTKARSLAAILTLLRSTSPVNAAAATTAPVATPALPAPPAAAPAETRLARFVVKTRSAPLPAASATLSGLALVLGAKDEISTALIRELKAHDLRIVHISTTEPQALRSAIARARSRHGPVRALLHLHGLEVAGVADLAGWRGLYQRDLLSLFHALQVCIEDLPEARVIGASRLGGSFARDAIGDGLPVAGGVNGILNCLRSEYPGCRARAVDFDGQVDAEIALLLAQELFSEDRETEAGYIGMERFGAATVEQPLVASPFPARVVPDGAWVLLATGGARGVTAEVVEELVRPGMRVVLLGRSAEPAAEDVVTAALGDAGALRQALLAQRLARGEKPRPVEIDREVARVLADREIRRNLARLRAAGAMVDYVACDVRDETALGAVIDTLYLRHGRIDAVLHGAGVIEDKLLADKSADSFERVLGTKLDPAFVFSRKLRADSLQLLAFFTSVAGRYGNRGQSDYAAANEALNRCAWELHRRFPLARVVAVNWGPWEGGMASDGVLRALRDRGMEPIPVAAGRRFFLDELARGPRNDVELVAGAGPWASLSDGAGAEPASAAQFAFVRRPPRVGLGGSMMLEHRLDLTDDPYLGDHVVDGQPLMPLAAILEYMAQFVATGWPRWQVAEICDLRALSSLVLDGDSGRDLVLRARAASHAETDSQTVSVEAFDPRRKDGVSFRASVILLPELPAAPLPQQSPLAGGQAIEGAGAYAELLFQGQRLHSLRRILSLAEAGADADLIASTPRSFLGDRGRGSAWLFDPALIDGAAQLALVWARLKRGRAALPVRFGRVRRFSSAPLVGVLRATQRLRTPDGASLRYDTEYLDASGRVCLLVEDGESTIRDLLARAAPVQPG